MAKTSTKAYLKSLQKRILSLESSINEMGIDAKVAHNKRRKTQTVSYHSMTRALCIETNDAETSGRVRFYNPMFHDPETPIKALPWAEPVSAMGGFDDCGLVWTPPAGSTVCILFENGMREQPFYIGTTWHRSRGPAGRDFGFPVQEYFDVSNGHRKGYLVGADDESQVRPPWDTESYNSKNFDSTTEYTKDIDAQKKSTYPNIYGFKTPEKHMVKLVDGNAKCNRRDKRIEILSGNGNWILLKDDHLHYGGQWAHPSCPPSPGGDDISLCTTNNVGVSNGQSDVVYTDFLGKPIEKNNDCNDPVLLGKSSNPLQPNRQKGSNPFFKHKNECRPYKGPGTPQNNKCDLPQSGMQFLSISGNTMVFDDSVEEPRGKPIWERSMENFDFGCTDKYLGRIYIKTATGHGLEMSDIEDSTGVRSNKNYIQLLSAGGNKIQLNDHTQGSGDDSSACPPNYAGEDRGIHIQSTSNHQINLVDHMNQQCSPKRKEGGIPEAKATQAYMQFKSGSGLEMMFRDSNSQETTQSQYIQITNPQCCNPSTDENCNPRGPHFLRFQGRPKGQPGVIFLRAGGHSVRSTYDMDVVLVGDKEKNPSDKFTYVSKNTVSSTEENEFRYAGQLHIMFAEQQILLMAGRDCKPSDGGCCSPCLYPIVLGKCPVICPLTGIVHWTEDALSDRVFASGKPEPCGESCTGDQASKDCDKKDKTQIDTGAGVLTV